MERLRLIIVDSDEEKIKKAEREMESEYIEIVGKAGNGVECLDIMERVEADVILTELMMPRMDGYLLIDRINERKEGKRPKIYIMTNMMPEAYITAALQKNVTYYFFKPLDYEIVSKVIVEKYASSPIWSSMTKMDKPKGKEEEKVKDSSQILDEKISRIFLSIGIPAHIKGYQYLRYAIKDVISNPVMINNITKQLYPDVAREYGSSASKVERAIRHAIDVAWSRGKIEYINKLFGFKVYSANEKPTNGEFIALVADKLMCESMEER